jgi:HD-GYP domain-containing protein (c-di-GMP phosphodiesterase class II)
LKGRYKIFINKEKNNCKNNKYNRNKYFKYTTEIQEDKSIRGKLEVTPEKGIAHPKNIIYYNWGHYYALMKKFMDPNKFEQEHTNNFRLYQLKDKDNSELIQRLSFELNENTGGFTIEADYNYNGERWFDKYSPVSILKNKSKKVLEEHLSEMQNHQKKIQNEIDSRTNIIKECEREFKDKDPEAAFHSLRLGHMMSKVGIQLGFSQKQLYVATVGSRLHDIGKYLIPNEIKNLPRRFTREERSFMEAHTLLGAYVLLEKGVEEEIVQMALFHHEAINGKGYPLKITKEVMGVENLLIQILDKIEAQYSSRVYRSSDLDASDVTTNINEDKYRGDLNPDLTDFMLNQSWPTLIKSGTVPLNYRFETKEKYSQLMEKEIGYVKGHHKDFDVTIPISISNLLEEYKSPVIFDKQTLKTRIKEEISRTYHEKIETTEYKSLFKKIIPESMFKDDNEFESFYLGEDRRDLTKSSQRLENKLKIAR